MKDSVKFKTVSIYVSGANGESHLYHENNDYQNRSKEDVIRIFKLEPLHMATELDGYDLGNMTTFNTYNWNAPYTLCGVSPEDMYDGASIVNIHLGGDARGNYSEPYICEETPALFLQMACLEVELTNGDTYSITCDNSEAYFDIEGIDPYCIEFDAEVTSEQIEILEELNER